MHYGLRAANYPITEEDFDKGDLPKEVWEVKDKLFGLTIDPQRLQMIREERRAGSEYASLRRCQADIRQAQTMFKRLGVPVRNTTNQSIEEISSHILRALKSTMRPQGTG